MEANHREMLTEVFCEVIENLAFMFGEAAEEGELEDSAGGYVLAAMSFSGPMSGRIELAVPREMRAEIAANVLGIDLDDELATSSADDALKELLNVTCGQVLTHLAGEEPVFDLGVPEVSDLAEDGWKAMSKAPGAAAVQLDEGPTLLRLVIGE